MSATIKALAYVSVIASVIFWLAKPLVLRFTTPSDFSRRRAVWFVLTLVAFLSPSFWIFAVVAAPLLLWAGNKDANPLAFYLLMMQLVPSTPVNIPFVGINNLFPIDLYRLLSICVLIPTSFRLRKNKGNSEHSGMQRMDILLLLYGALQIALRMPTHSTTNAIREALLFYLDVYVLYFVASRSCRDKAAIAEALSAFCLAGALMAAVAVFEGARHWLLYESITTTWTEARELNAYVYRSGALRAQASSGNVLVLGYLLAIAIGFWTYIRGSTSSRWFKLLAAVLLCLGLAATYARGAWIGAAVIFFTYAAIGRQKWSKLGKTITLSLLLAAIIGVTPAGDKVISMFSTTTDSPESASILYRHRIAMRTLELIRQSPFFGDQQAYSKMEDLRQGQGIIDVVNTYAGVALFSGLVGLVLFLSFILAALATAYSAMKRTQNADAELSALGSTLVACIIGTLVMLATCSFILGYEKLFYILAGLSVGYACASSGTNRLPPSSQLRAAPGISAR